MNALECKAYLERIGYQEEPHTDKDCLEKKAYGAAASKRSF